MKILIFSFVVLLTGLCQSCVSRGNSIPSTLLERVEAPKSLEDSIVNIDSKLSLYIQNGIAYVGSYSSNMKSKPKIRQVGKDQYGNPRYTDGRIRCNRYSYRPQGNKAQLFFSYTARHEYQVCQSASEVNEGTYIDYSYKDVPATITITNKNGNTYEGTISGVYGSPEMSNPPEKLSKIQIIK